MEQVYFSQIGRELETVWVRPVPAQQPQRRTDVPAEPVRVTEPEREVVHA